MRKAVAHGEERRKGFGWRGARRGEAQGVWMERRKERRGERRGARRAVAQGSGARV
jgi:hypothetical protein